MGLEHGAGIEVEKGATLVITEQSNGSLKAVGGAYGAAGIGGNADAVSYFQEPRNKRLRRYEIWDRNDYNQGWNH